MPFFSVTIPVYNVEKYLRQCLDSVLNQTFQDFEVVLLDDGSTDRSGRICDEYSVRDSRIRVIHNKNQGLLMARRNALRYVHGEYILFLDSDDYWEKELLECIYNILSENKVDMVYFRYKAVNQDGKELYQQKKLLENKEFISEADKFLCYQLATGFEYNSMVLKAVKREKLDIDGNYENVREVSMGEDALQSAKMAANLESMIYLDKALYNYRVNISSISTKITKKHLSDYLKVRETIDCELKKFYNVDTKEYLQKIEYDVRGFVGLLADSAVSSFIDTREWKEMKEEIKQSSLLKTAYRFRRKMNFISKVYLFIIVHGYYWTWKLLGKVKFLLKYLYDRFF